MERPNPDFFYFPVGLEATAPTPTATLAYEGQIDGSDPPGVYTAEVSR